MSRSVTIEGLADLDDILLQLKPAAGKTAMRRAAVTALQPMDDAWRAGAPVKTGHLKESGGIGTKLTRSQRAAVERENNIEVYCGPSGDPAATQTEFGNHREAAQPFMRPAWDQTQDQVLDRLGTAMAFEVDAASARAIKRGGKQGF